MKKLAIKAENISKQYRLGEVGTGTLSHDLNRFWNKMRGKEDPYLKIGEANDRNIKGDSDYVWSLKDINFEVEQGDAVGIIGRNGAGKSTLLKLLSKVTKPTTGSFKFNGRIASLLEVGTGFNPEMTGRENIYLNGAILGMRRAEITRKLDEIIAFSGVERYIDTPVKRYSSGMYVRLAFAVAAHLESEILIVDEVLAVGDAEFQKKCLSKMGEVSKGEGRTVLFVSHNIASIKTLCNRGLFLKNGQLELLGDVDTAIEAYLNSMHENQSSSKIQIINEDTSFKDAKILEASVRNAENQLLSEFDVFNQVFIHIRFKIAKRLSNTTPLIIIQKDGVDLINTFMSDLDENILEKLEPGIYDCRVPLPCPLKKGTYTCLIKIGRLKIGDIDLLNDLLTFNIEEISFDPTVKSFSSFRPGIYPANIKWVFNKTNNDL
jgi:lipopolysaccharide transport system ATP-binding protein